MNERTTALLVVPNGTHRPEPLADALRTHHPDWQTAAVWCGDPYLRPLLDGVAWIDGGADEVGLTAGDVSVGEWRQAVAATSKVLADGVGTVVLLWVGSTAVLGGLDGLVRAGAPVTLVVRAVDGLPIDGLAPTEVDLVPAGLYSTSVAVFGGGAAHALQWLDASLNGRTGVGPVLARAAQLFGATDCRDPAISVGRWRWDVEEPALLDVAGYDCDSPWTLDPETRGPLRVELLGRPDRQATMLRAAPQLAGHRTPLCLPGGLRVDATVRQVVADAAEPPPSPWAASAAFRAWLAPRYWKALHAERRDLWTAFPDSGGRSAAGFRTWCRAAFSVDDVPLLVPPVDVEGSSVFIAEPLDDNGLNLVGYLTRASSLGDVARRLGDAVSQAEIAHTTIATQRTASPVQEGVAVDNRAEFTNTLCVVTADQFPFLAADFPEVFAATKRMIGYWFWELEHVPLHMRQAISLVDEIWAGSRFVTDAFAAISPVPVRHVPIPIAEPQRSQRTFDLPTNRPILITVFDHLSVTERKNPLGVIDAFCRAFAPNEGPLLIIKTMNGHQRWANHQRVLAAADGRDDIRVWDETLSRSDQMALVAAADCMVSLHRSEGLGLHLAEAMWLGTPTIATRYSGNLDFMSDDNSLLIDYELVNVERGEGVYPPTATWADPDLDRAAAAMRRVAGDAELRTRLATAGRRTMEHQPTLAETGRLIGQLLLGGK
jgi:glycosyltransferase involved in cell wall biosynthesis